jgi:AcrR family transcriptional regulator
VSPPASSASSASAPKRTRRGHDRRRAILQEAREVFTSKGYEHSSMAEIAARVGVVEGAIYKHFGSKRELMFEATGDFYAPLVTAAKAQLAGIRGTRNRLRFLIWGQLESLARFPGLCRLIVFEIRPHDDYRGSVLHAIDAEVTGMLLEILEQARAAGELRAAVEPRLVCDVLFGAIEHIASKVLAERGELDPRAEAAALSALILNGVLAAPQDDDTPDEREEGRLRAQVDRLEAVVAKLAATISASPSALGGSAVGAVQRARQQPARRKRAR